MRWTRERCHGRRWVEQNPIHGSRRLRRIVRAGAGDNSGRELVHDGRTVREIPRVMRRMMPGNPGAREVLLIQRYRVVPIHFRVQYCRSCRRPLRSRLRKSLCRHLMSLGEVLWITVIARAGFLRFFAGLTRGFCDPPLLQSASQLGFTGLVSLRKW